MDYNINDLIIKHYESIWQSRAIIKTWKKGPINDITTDFCVLEFAPNEYRNMWTYATCSMSNIEDNYPIEVHLFSSKQTDECVELLSLVAYYHKTYERLNIGHTVNFGKPWQGASECTYGFISLPYMDGPELENFTLHNKAFKFYWLIPITEKELNYKTEFGVESLEEKMEASSFDYIDANRKSLV